MWLVQQKQAVPIARGVEHAYLERVDIINGFGICEERTTVDYLQRLGYQPIAEFKSLEELQMRHDPLHVIRLSRDGLGPLAALDDGELDRLETAVRQGNMDVYYEMLGRFNEAAAPQPGTRPVRKDEILERVSRDLPEADLELFPGATILAPPDPHPDNNENPARVEDPGAKTDMRADPNQSGRQGQTEGDSFDGPDAEALQMQQELFETKGNDPVFPPSSHVGPGGPTPPAPATTTVAPSGGDVPPESGLKEAKPAKSSAETKQ